MGILINSLVPELSVSNVNLSLAFYVDVLGFSIKYERKEDGFAFLTLGDAQIMIDQVGVGRTWKTGEFSYPLGRGINLQIKVASIMPLLERLKQHHIALFLEAEEKCYQTDVGSVVQKQFLVTDPDGYLLRFIELVR